MVMRGDPVVAEIHAIRDKLAAERGYDVKEIVRCSRQRKAVAGLEYSPRRTTLRQNAVGPPSDDSAQRDDYGD